MAYIRITRAVAIPGGLGPGGVPGAIAGVGGPGGEEGSGLATIAAAVPGGGRPQRLYWVAGYSSILVGFVAGLVLYAWISPPEFKPAAGFDSFAVFYIVAQSLERFFEPIVNFVRGSVPGTASMSKPDAAAVRDTQLALASSASDGATITTAVNAAAAAQATVDQIRANASILVWGAQSGLAMAFSGALGLFLLRGVGAGGVPVGLDMFITGIAIGGGSKALHDLIKSVQATKENQQDPPETQGAT